VEDFDELVEKQHGVFRRDQAYTRGITKSRVSAQLAAERWQVLFADVLATTTGTPTRVMERQAALLYSERDGNTTALGLSSSAEIFDFGLPSRKAVHTLIDGWAKPKIEDKVHPHRSRRGFAVEDLTVHDGMLVVAPARTVVDLSGRMSERELRYLVARVLRAKTAAAAEIEAAIERAGRAPGTATLRQLLPLAAKVRSGGELRLVQGLLARGWPCEPGGLVEVPGMRLREGDALLRALRFVVQVESIAHHALDPDQRLDLTRDIDYGRVGYGFTRVAVWRIEHELARLLDELDEVLALRARDVGRLDLVPPAARRHVVSGGTT
jgi:hypothetical protein